MSPNEILDGTTEEISKETLNTPNTFLPRSEGREDWKRKGEKTMENRQIDKKTTMQIRVDRGLHHQLKILAANEGRTIKQLVEEALGELLALG